MGNSAYKREMANRHNENRALVLKREAELAADKLANPEKYRRKTRGERRAEREAKQLLAVVAGLGVSPTLLGKSNRLNLN